VDRPGVAVGGPPGGELRVSFSSVPETAGRAYYLTGGTLFQYDVDTEASTRLVGFGEGRHTWLQHDRQDEWFAFMKPGGSGAVAWNRLTGESLVVEEEQVDGSLDDIRIDRDGRTLNRAAGGRSCHSPGPDRPRVKKDSIRAKPGR